MSKGFGFVLFPKTDTRSWQIKISAKQSHPDNHCKMPAVQVSRFPPPFLPGTCRFSFPCHRKPSPLPAHSPEPVLGYCKASCKPNARLQLPGSPAPAWLFLGTKEEQVENEPHRQTAAFHLQEFILSRKRRASFLSKHVGLQLCSHLAVLPRLWGTTYRNSRARWGWFDFRTPIPFSCLENAI